MTEPWEEPNATSQSNEAPPIEEAAEDHIQTKKSRESLKCLLTESEISELGKRGARAGAAIRQKESELQAVKSQFKAEIDKLQAERNECEGKINTGWEFRPVDCKMIKDFRENTLRVVRLDTYETVRERTLTAEERQQLLLPKEVGTETETEGAVGTETETEGADTDTEGDAGATEPEA